MKDIIKNTDIEKVNLYKKFKKYLKKKNIKANILSQFGNIIGFQIPYKVPYNWKENKDKVLNNIIEKAKKDFYCFYDSDIYIKVTENNNIKKVCNNIFVCINVNYEWLVENEYIIDSEEIGLL